MWRLITFQFHPLIGNLDKLLIADTVWYLFLLFHMATILRRNTENFGKFNLIDIHIFYATYMYFARAYLFYD